MRLTIFLILISLSLSGITQKISGYVLDLNTQMPVPYASIFFKGTTLGTVSSIDGGFMLENNDSIIYQSIVIRCVGYKSHTIDLNGDLNLQIKIELEESIQYLDEVVVEPLPNGVDLVRCVTEKINNGDWYSKKFDSEYFYRNTLKTDGLYSAFLESYGFWHSEGFLKEHLSENNHAYIEYFEFYRPKHIRAKISHPSADPIFQDRLRLPNIWAFCKAYYYLLPDSDKLSWYDYETEDKIINTDHTSYKVSFALTKKGFKKAEKAFGIYERLPGFTLSKGTLYINSEDCAIEQIDFTFNAYGVIYSGIVKFMKHNNEYYRHYMQLISRYDASNSKVECVDEIFWSDFKDRLLNEEQLLIEFGMTRKAHFNNLATLSHINSLYNPEEYPKINQLVPGLLVYLSEYDPLFWKTKSIPRMLEREQVYKDLKISEEDFSKFDFEKIYSQFFKL